jgi:hypothetical protein
MALRKNLLQSVGASRKQRNKKWDIRSGTS